MGAQGQPLPLPVYHRGSRDALGRLSRPVRVPWVCHRTGDCCRENTGVAVSANERGLLEHKLVVATRVPVFTVHPDDQAVIDRAYAQGVPAPSPKFYILEKGPCPYLAGDNTCLVYDIRPYNCRRFACGRTDPTQESLESGGSMGCYNLSDRLETSLRFMEWYRAFQRRAQDWARLHGWKA